MALLTTRDNKHNTPKTNCTNIPEVDIKLQDSVPAIFQGNNFIKFLNFIIFNFQF